ATIRLVATFQGCQDEGICYPPMTRSVEVALPAAGPRPDPEATAAAEPAPRPGDAPVAGVQVDHAATSVADGAAAADAPGPASADTAVDASADNAARTRPPAAGLPAGGAIGALVLALLGGLVLNLMPCVLPILSLKVLGLAQSGEGRQRARSHALWYTAGVLASFAAIGALVLALRGGGQGGLGHSLASRSGPAGDFFTGVLACVVASPCIAPFMGGALAFAFTAPPWLALLVFLALGLGLALPFLLVGLVPALADRLPKPGAWMETLKQVLAFPMDLTAIWLLWVLGKQRGVDAMALVAVGLVVFALALWWFERRR